MGLIPSVSFPPVVTCNPYATCHKSCYALKAWRMYPSVRNAYNDNLTLWQRSQVEYTRQLKNWFMKNKPEYFRYNVSGDIPDMAYMVMVLSTASMTPKTKQLIFTKQDKFISTGWTPDNLTIRLSYWEGFTPNNRFNLPEAHIKYKDGRTTLPENCNDYFVCPNDCTNCKACWNKKIKRVLFDIH